MHDSGSLPHADARRLSRRRWLRIRRAGFGAVAVLAVVAAVMVPTGVDHAEAATDGQMVIPASGFVESKVGDGCRGTARTHQGIDISGPGGTPILAAYDGVVKIRSYNSGYGNFVDIEHPGGYMTRYAHMPQPSPVAPGTTVERGQQIGVVGRTGNSTGNHLHFEVWRNGKVWPEINQAFTCLTHVTRGTTMQLSFPGLATAAPVKGPGADYDADGRNDLMVVAADSDLVIFRGVGTGTFAPAEIVTSAWGNRRHLTHADVDGDGDSDLIVARADGVLERYSGSGGRGFDGYGIIGTRWYDMLHVTSGADYTGDGRQDLLAVDASGALSIHPGNAAGTLTETPRRVGSGWQSFASIVGGDFNGDGRGDIMGVDAAGTLFFYQGTGSGFAERRRIGSGWTIFNALTGGVDYDGDRRVDLLAVTPAGELHLYGGKGDGTVREGMRVGTIGAGALQVE